MQKKSSKGLFISVNIFILTIFFSNNIYSQNQLSSGKIPSQTITVLTVIKNPITDILDLKYTSESNQEIQLQLVDNMGKVVLSRQFNVLKGENMFKLEEVARLSSGLYILSVMDKKLNKYHAKVIKN
ncbi:MAG: T9SS type A sorting domain-containing protein [Ferruginibacter sp.]